MNSATRSKTAWLILLALAITANARADGTDATGAVLPVNGIQMYYEASGEGTPLVLLHGFNASSARWASMVPDLAKTYRVVVPDLRGHGRSTNPTKQFTHRQSALDVFALLDSLGIRQFKAMGISTGGMTLIHMATQQPSRIEAMVLIGATTFFPEQARAIMRAATLESMTATVWEQRRLIHTRGDEQIRELQQQFHNFKDSYDDMNFTQPFLSTIAARTLIVHGDRDLFFPVEIPLEMYRGIPKASLWIIPQGGHVPIFDPAVPFVPTALKFLGGN